MSFPKTRIRFKRFEMYHFIQKFKTKSGFCVWCYRTPRRAAYVSQFHWESGRRSSPLSGSYLKSGLIILNVRKVQCCTSYTYGELCSNWSRFPVILVVSCSRFDRGSQLYLRWAINVRLTKPTAPMSFDKPYLRGFQWLPIRRLTSATALNLIEDVAWLGTWARSCVVPDFSQDVYFWKCEICPKTVIPICGTWSQFVPEVRVDNRDSKSAFA